MKDPGTRRSIVPHAPVSFSVPDAIKAARLPIAIIGLLVIFGLIEPRVLSAGNFRNIAIQASYLAIFAMAQTIVILTRGFDLSLGYTVSLVSVTASLAMVYMGGGDGAIVFGFATGLVLAAAVGTANGLLGLGALINVCAALPANFIAFEYPVATTQWWPDIVTGLPKQIVKDSMIDVLPGPGLGLDIDAEGAKKYLAEDDRGFFDRV